MIEKEILGRDQSYARAVNNELVIQKLRERDYSATDLANDLNLSHAAISSILKGLVNDNIIRASYSGSTAGKGRKRVFYSLNEAYGLIIVVSLSNNRYEIIISNIREEILLEFEKEITNYDVATIYEIVLKIKDILMMVEYRDIPLRSIIIAVPGRVNAITGELQLSKHFDADLFDGKNSIKNIFSKYFDAPITLDNDINLSIIGEMKCGCLKSINNAMLAYIDNGIGGALIIDGKFYGGDNGYAGEFGLMHTSFHGEESYLDEFASLRSIKEYAKKKFNRSFVVNDLVKAYEKHGELYDYINETAHLVGKKLRDVIELLNVSHVVISGRVSLFGIDYLHHVNEEVNKSKNTTIVEYSKLSKKSILIGAISKSVEQSIPHMSGNIKSTQVKVGE